MSVCRSFPKLYQAEIKAWLQFLLKEVRFRADVPIFRASHEGPAQPSKQQLDKKQHQMISKCCRTMSLLWNYWEMMEAQEAHGFAILFLLSEWTCKLGKHS